MRRLFHLLTLLLLLLFIQITSKAQTDIGRDIRVDPVLKQVAAQLPGLKIFGRKDGNGGYVNMAVLDETKQKLKWFTCHGVAFDSLELTNREYSQLAADSIDPFVLYRNYCHERLLLIEQAELQYRLKGNLALEDTSCNNRVVFSATPVKSAKSTLQKLVAIEGLMKRVGLKLRLFESKPPRQLIKPKESDNVIRSGFAGIMINTPDSTEYYNINPVTTVAKIVLRRHSTDKLYVYNQEKILIDSVPLKTNKYVSLLKEKEDVFLLYRGWLELQWQQIIDNKSLFTEQLNRLDSSLYRSVSWEQNKRQLQNIIIGLQNQQDSVDSKIRSLIVPEVKYVEQQIADIYEKETSEISYLPGLGFAYSISYTRGQKLYELAERRSNVMASVSDKKIGTDENEDGIAEYYNADVANADDYYPFGMLQPGRNFDAGNKYRYGYNGKENDNEIKGEANSQDYGMRIYDPRVGRFLSTDPLTKSYPELTPYQFASNTPIWTIDIDGAEGGIPLDYSEAIHDIYRGVKNWLNEPLTPRGQAMGKGLMISVSNGQVDEAPTKRWQFWVLAVGQFSKHYGGSWPGSLKYRTPNIEIETPQTPKVNVSKSPGATELAPVNSVNLEGEVSVPSSMANSGSRNPQAPAVFFKSSTLEKFSDRSGDQFLGGEFKFTGAVSKLDREAEFLSLYHANGKTLELKDAALYIRGLSNKEGAKELGSKGVFHLLNSLKENAKKEGFKVLKISYKRTDESSSKTPGHTADQTFEL